MRFRCFRFTGLHVEPLMGAFVTGAERLVRLPNGRTIADQLEEPDRFSPTCALVFVDILLQRGESVVAFPRNDQEQHDRGTCESEGGECFRRCYLVAPDASLIVRSRRRGGEIVTVLRCNNGELVIESQDKPAGC